MMNALFCDHGERIMYQQQPTQQVVGVVLLGIATLLVAIVWATKIALSRDSPGSCPPGPRPWPIIGNLPILAGPRAYRALAHLAEQYNTSVLSIRLGSTPTLVACTAGSARQFLHTHDVAFSDRPALFSVPEHLLFGRANVIGFQNAGARWRELRKLWTTRLLSQARIAEKSNVRQAEVAHMVDNIRRGADSGTTSLNILTCVSHVTCNIMGRLVLSERLIETVRQEALHPLHTIVEETVRLLFTPLVGDFVRFLSFLDARAKRRMRALRARAGRLLGLIVARRVRARSDGIRFDDILDLLLDHTTEDQAFLNATILEMFIVGVDTSANTMNWAMAELLANPQEMRKVQQELEAVVGMERMVNDDDLEKLTYLRAIIKETFRLHPVASMMIPHMSKEACEIEVLGVDLDGTDKTYNYKIQAGTMVFINLWAIGRDKHVWEQPDQFKPERFVDSAIDLKGQHFELLPFGSGRRMCPGMSQGLHVVELTLANLLHCFHWSPSTSTVDLSESKSSHARALTLANPLLAFPTFRLKT